MSFTIRALFFCLLFDMAASAKAEPVVSPTNAAPAVSSRTGGPSGAAQTWVLAYFRQRYDSRVEIDAQGQVSNVPLPEPMAVEQLHLALSTDGRHWTPLNDNQPVWEQRVRDPFIRRDADGLWHLVATGAARDRRTAGPGRGPVCLHATSRDLIHWQEARSLWLMEGVTNNAGGRPRNIWAPAWTTDPKTGETVLYWSSSFEDAGWKRSRLWQARTRDWKSFTPAQVLFAPPYSVIDGDLLERDGKYYLFHKEEEFGAATGERRAIRVATADALEGPYQIHQGPLNQGQIVPVITEGPSVMPDLLKPGWLLLYDFCMSNGYGASSSPDLLTWTVEKDVSFPPDARHGSVARLTEAEAARLKEKFAK